MNVMEANNAMITTLVGYLAKKLKGQQSVQDFFGDFTDAAVHWIRPLFLKEDNKYEKIIEDLMKNPDSPIKQQQVATALASHLEDQPENEKNLKAMYEELQEKAKTDKSINIINSKNVVTGTIHAGGNVVIGDNNNTHSPNE